MVAIEWIGDACQELNLASNEHLRPRTRHFCCRLASKTADAAKANADIVAAGRMSVVHQARAIGSDSLSRVRSGTSLQGTSLGNLSRIPPDNSSRAPSHKPLRAPSDSPHISLTVPSYTPSDGRPCTPSYKSSRAPSDSHSRTPLDTPLYTAPDGRARTLLDGRSSKNDDATNAGAKTPGEWALAIVDGSA